MRTLIFAGCIALAPGLAMAQSGLTASQIAAATEACGGPIASAEVLPTGQLSVKCQRTARGASSEEGVVSQAEGGGGLFGIGAGTAGAISTSAAIGLAGFATVGVLAAVGANNDSSSGTVSTTSQ